MQEFFSKIEERKNSEVSFYDSVMLTLCEQFNLYESLKTDKLVTREIKNYKNKNTVTDFNNITESIKPRISYEIYENFKLEVADISINCVPIEREVFCGNGDWVKMYVFTVDLLNPEGKEIVMKSEFGLLELNAVIAVYENIDDVDKFLCVEFALCDIGTKPLFKTTLEMIKM